MQQCNLSQGHTRTRRNWNTPKILAMATTEIFSFSRSHSSSSVNLSSYIQSFTHVYLDSTSNFVPLIHCPVREPVLALSHAFTCCHSILSLPTSNTLMILSLLFIALLVKQILPCATPSLLVPLCPYLVPLFPVPAGLNFLRDLECIHLVPVAAWFQRE